MLADDAGVDAAEDLVQDEDTEDEIIRRATKIARYYGMALSDFPDFHFVSLVGYAQPEFVEFDGNACDYDTLL